MTLPPIVELIFAAQKVAGLGALEALDGPVPYSWLLRFRTFLWYSESIGASPRFGQTTRNDGWAERMIG